MEKLKLNIVRLIGFTVWNALLVWILIHSQSNQAEFFASLFFLLAPIYAFVLSKTVYSHEFSYDLGELSLSSTMGAVLAAITVVIVWLFFKIW